MLCSGKVAHLIGTSRATNRINSRQHKKRKEANPRYPGPSSGSFLRRTMRTWRPRLRSAEWLAASSAGARIRWASASAAPTTAGVATPWQTLASEPTTANWTARVVRAMTPRSVSTYSAQPATARNQQNKPSEYDVELGTWNGRYGTESILTLRFVRLEREGAAEGVDGRLVDQ